MQKYFSQLPSQRRRIEVDRPLLRLLLVQCCLLKVETIGDAYMVVSGVPNFKETQFHAKEIGVLSTFRAIRSAVFSSFKILGVGYKGQGSQIAFLIFI